MSETLKSIGETAAGILVLLAIITVIAFFFVGGVWLGETILPSLISVASLILVLDICLLLPLAVFRATRGASGIGLFLSSYVYGATVWLWSLVLVDAVWGVGMVIVGMFIAGIGVVPLAVIATGVNGASSIAGQIIFLVALTYGFRMAGLYLSADRPDYEPAIDSFDDSTVEAPSPEINVTK